VNLRRGLFRVWIVFTVLCAVFVIADDYNHLKGELVRTQLLATATGRLKALIPMPCPEARGKIEADYRRGDRGFCWYNQPSFRILYPEYVDVPDYALPDKMLVKAGLPPTTPDQSTLLLGYLRTGWQYAIKILWFPLAVFVIGFGLLWAGEGFRSRA
jgi:hypothetical protein